MHLLIPNYSLAALMNVVGGFPVTIRDIFDVLFLAFLFYASFRLLKETHSVPMVFGIITFVVFYGVVRALDLPVTNLVLKSFFEVFLIIIAIVFQKELRRFFSFFGLLSFLRREPNPTEISIATISRAVVHLMRERKGALIVFPGHEDTGSFMESGSDLNGEISESILLSIFDETSPGHDGAVIIENNLIKKFAVHLPLAENLEKLRQFGLRHRAALGMSERSDALVVVVSEEKGTVRLARGGNFENIYDELELRAKLAAFFAEKFPRRNIAAVGEWFVKNGPLFGTALLAAIAFWFIANPQLAIIQRSFTVSPEFTSVPQGMLIGSVKPQTVNLVIQGRSADFDSLSAEDVRLAIPLNKNISVGTEKITLGADNAKLPGNFTVIRINPAALTIQVTKQ